MNRANWKWFPEEKLEGRQLENWGVIKGKYNRDYNNAIPSQKTQTRYQHAQQQEHTKWGTEEEKKKNNMQQTKEHKYKKDYNN